MTVTHVIIVLCDISAFGQVYDMYQSANQFAYSISEKLAIARFTSDGVDHTPHLPHHVISSDSTVLCLHLLSCVLIADLSQAIEMCDMRQASCSTSARFRNQISINATLTPTTPAHKDVHPIIPQALVDILTGLLTPTRKSTMFHESTKVHVVSQPQHSKMVSPLTIFHCNLQINGSKSKGRILQAPHPHHGTMSRHVLTQYYTLSITHTRVSTVARHVCGMPPEVSKSCVVMR